MRVNFANQTLTIEVSTIETYSKPDIRVRTKNLNKIDSSPVLGCFDLAVRVYESLVLNTFLLLSQGLL